MKRLSFAIAAIGCAIGAAAPAAAAPFITPVTLGAASFGNPSLTCSSGATLPCSFTDTITFTTPAGYNLTSATLSSSMVGTDMTTDVNFTSVTLNGASFSTIQSGYTEFRALMNQALTPGGTNTLIVSGTTGGNGSYAGTLSFTASAVPEASTWLMMILGFGAIGHAMRRRPGIAVAVA